MQRLQNSRFPTGTRRVPVIVAQTQGHPARLIRVFEKLGPGIVAITKDKKIRLASAQARRYAAEYFAARFLKGEHLPDRLQTWLRQQETLVAGQGDGRLPGRPLVVDRGARRLRVQHFCGPAECLLLLEERQNAPRSASVKPLGLTCRETAVLTWVAQGKTDAEIGTILRNSPRTVQKHLQGIYQKLGVENRTAAAARTFAAATGGN